MAAPHRLYIRGGFVASGMNGLPQGGGYAYRGIPGWDPARTLAPPRTPSTPRPKSPAEHGTVAGFSRHQRLHETACEPCRAAHREYGKAYKAAKRASTGEATS